MQLADSCPPSLPHNTHATTPQFSPCRYELEHVAARGREYERSGNVEVAAGVQQLLLRSGCGG
jgi:hypothetical protein